jgi:glucose/arabinose dehydrogenase
LGIPTQPLVHHDVIAEWQVDPANPSRVNPLSRREVLRIRGPGVGHNTEQILFNPNLRPGAAGYGLLYVSVGDGKNNPKHTDPYDNAQNPGSPHGKILRIDPLAREGRSYTVPATNPFVGRSGSLPEVWALGLRNPQFMCFDTASVRHLILSSAGQAQIESIYLGAKGANYG